MRIVYCAECGEQNEIRSKAIPALQKVYDLIRPHNCGKPSLEPITEKAIKRITEDERKGISPSLDALFDSFKFVRKLNGLEPESDRDSAMAEVHKENYGDKRNKDHLRKELSTSSAPLNLLSNIRSIPHTIPVGDIREEPKGD